MDQYGDKETKEVLDLVLTVFDIGKKALSDGKISLEDAGLLTELVPVVGPAFGDVSKVPAELAHLSADEATDLVAYVTSKLSVGDVKAQKIAQAGLKVAAAAYELYLAIEEPMAAAPLPVSGAV